jgi:hypothetical protein
MIRTFLALMHVDPGFTAPESLQTFRFYIPERRSPIRRPSAWSAGRGDSQQLAAIPGVSSVSFEPCPDGRQRVSNDVLYAQDHGKKAKAQLPAHSAFQIVSPGAFHLGTRMVAGRDLTWTDDYDRSPVAIISENFAREYWHDRERRARENDPRGLTDEWREIVGVAQDVHDDGVEPGPAHDTVYWPTDDGELRRPEGQLQRGVAFVIRSPRAGSQAFMKEVQQQVWSVNSERAAGRPVDPRSASSTPSPWRALPSRW